MKYLGSCLCGNIKFEIHGTFESFYLCHCKSCQKDTGSAHAANIFSSNAELIWLQGQDKVKTFNYNNSGHIKSFCPNCGSALPNLQMEGELVVTPAGSLDSTLQIKPTGHIYLEEKADWDKELNKVPQFGTLPD